jgi:hypothetical protein
MAKGDKYQATNGLKIGKKKHIRPITHIIDKIDKII